MFDVVHEDILKEENLEETLKQLNITTLYVCKNINKKEDVNFFIPDYKGIKIKKAFILSDLNLYNSVKNISGLFLFSGKSLSSNTKAVSTKFPISLLDPIGEELCFDEGLVNLSKQNNKIIFFNVNEIKNNQHRAIKQMNFLVPLLLSKKIEMRFVTLAKSTHELIDEKILTSFLKNYFLEKPIIEKFLNIER